MAQHKIKNKNTKLCSAKENNIKEEEIGKKYIRVPHPTLKKTFILKEK